MIIQKVKITKHTTEDGLWTIRNGETMIGKEIWVLPTRVALVMTNNSDKKARTLRCMIPLAESPLDGIPVELLEFSNEFKRVPDIAGL